MFEIHVRNRITHFLTHIRTLVPVSIGIVQKCLSRMMRGEHTCGMKSEDGMLY